MAEPLPTPSLTGLRLLLTRPAEQAAVWLAKLSEAGVDIHHVPTLAIAMHPPNRERLLAFARALDAVVASRGCCIFISQNAVRSTQAYLARLPDALPDTAAKLQEAAAQLPCIAVGPSTAAFAIAQGFVNCDGSSHDSESLLQLGTLQASKLIGRKVLLLKGDGGRNTIASGLRERGADLTELSLYQRLVPAQNKIALQQALGDWQPHVVSATSVDSVRNTVALAEPEATQALLGAALLVPGARVAQFARQQGFNIVLQSRSTDIADILYSLDNWWQQQLQA